MNLMIVDDNRFVVDGLNEDINWKKLGIEQVFCCYGIISARKVFSQEKIDFVIADIEMPGGSGLDLVAKMKEDREDLEVVFLTSYADFSYAQRAIKMECRDYILKPADPGQVEIAVRKMIEHRAKRDSEESDAFPDNDAESRKIIDEMKAYIKQNLADVDRQQIAERFGFSISYLSRLFVKKTGMTLSDYIFRKRMNRAMDLLENTDRSISDIAECVGFATHTHFSLRFKQYTGMTPMDYRREKSV